MKAFTLNEPKDADEAGTQRTRPARRPVRNRSEELRPRRGDALGEAGTMMSGGDGALALPAHTRLPVKTARANIRKDYALTIELSLIAALLVLIWLFHTSIQFQADLENLVTEQEVVQMEEIVQTEQIEKPPPPPRPQAPVVVADDVILDDMDLDLDATLDIDEPLADLPPPPPPPEEEEAVEEDEQEIFVVVEQMPELIGGIEALQARLRYPEMARLAGISGRVFVEFIVDQQGNVTNPVVIRGIGGGCDEEALRVVKDAKFKPGMQRGKAVRVRYVLPIVFMLK